MPAWRNFTRWPVLRGSKHPPNVDLENRTWGKSSSNIFPHFWIYVSWWDELVGSWAASAGCWKSLLPVVGNGKGQKSCKWIGYGSNWAPLQNASCFMSFCCGYSRSIMCSVTQPVGSKVVDSHSLTVGGFMGRFSEQLPLFLTWR